METYILTPQEYQELTGNLERIGKKYSGTIKDGYSSGAEQDGHHDEGFQLSKATSGVLLSQVRSIQMIINNCRIEIPEEQNMTVKFGVGVLVEYQDNHTIEKFVVSGYVLDDSAQSKVSMKSPIGKALIGKKEGEIIEVSLPTKTRKIKIIRIFLPSQIGEMFKET